MIREQKKKKIKIWSFLLKLTFSAIISGEIVAGLYAMAIYNGEYELLPYKYIPVFLLIFAVLFLSGLCKGKRGLIITAGLSLLLFAGALLIPGADNYYVENVVYNIPDTKAETFTDKKVMVLVPHQDDELNILGGTIEEYTKYGSEVFVVFSTNGDYYGTEETRFQEVEKVMARLGVDENHVITLGYGDQWRDGHLYNAGPDEEKVSNIGKTRTYGVGKFPAFDEGKVYTKNNFLQDVKNVVLKYMPDIIYCVDYDGHLDHKALSMSFEKAMGEILAQYDYAPLVMKAFAYPTAYFAPEDYGDSPNLEQTKNPYETEYIQENNIYLWKDRIRLPVCASALARDMEMAPLYETCFEYLSQALMGDAPGIINSDKVVWQRETGSISYNARISASSGEAGKLSDFMLVDSRKIEDPSAICDGTWVPEAEDSEKEIYISFDEPKNIHRIKLYDNPSLEDNILEMEISLDNGRKILTGPLMKNGSETQLSIEERDVREIKLRISQAEGKNAGLTEVEIFESQQECPYNFIKLIDRNENFAYDYLTEEEITEFSLYSPWTTDKLQQDQFSVDCDNKKCSAYLEDGKLFVRCKDGQSCLVTVEHLESGLKDSIRVRNISEFQRKITELSKEHYEKQRLLNQEQFARFGRPVSRNIWGMVFVLARENIFGLKL